MASQDLPPQATPLFSCGEGQLNNRVSIAKSYAAYKQRYAADDSDCYDDEQEVSTTNADLPEWTEEVPHYIDISKTVLKPGTTSHFSRHAVVATTADEKYHNEAAFLAMLEEQKKGTLKKKPTDQLWAFRDRRSSSTNFTVPHVFLNSEGKRSGSKANKRHSNVCVVLKINESIMYVAEQYYKYLRKPTGGPLTDLQKQHLKCNNIFALAKELQHHFLHTKTKVEGSDDPSHIDYTVQIGANSYVPIAPTLFFHRNAPDTDLEVFNKPKKDSEVSSSSSSSSSSSFSKKKSAKRQCPSSPEKPVKARRGCELSDITGIIDDDDEESDVDDNTEDADDEIKHFNAAMTKLIDLVRDDELVDEDDKYAPRGGLTSILLQRMKEQMPILAEMAVEKVDSSRLDNPSLMSDVSDDNLSVLRRNVGINPKLHVLPHDWLTLIFLNRGNDPQAKEFVASAEPLIFGASAEWAVQSMTPMRWNQIPIKWGGLMKGRWCEEVLALKQFEDMVLAILKERTNDVMRVSIDLIEKQKKTHRHASSLSKQLEQANESLSASESRVASLEDKIRDLEAQVIELTVQAKDARKSSPKLPALEPKKSTVNTSF